MYGDGDGWVTCELGHRHWGRNGAAGLLLRARAAGTDGAAGSTGRLVLVQLRVAWSDQGGTWGLLGGARDSHETVIETALREAGEEGGIRDAGLRVAGVYLDDHGGWSYSTVLADVDAAFPVRPANAESDELRWVAEHEVAELPLHPHFAVSWPTLRSVPSGPTVIVDAANVVGSRPDGWWRDRLGATRRLRDRLAPLPWRSLTAEDLVELDERYDVPGHWHADLHLVVEGAASPLAKEPTTPGVDVVAAEGSGDDAIVTMLANGLRARHGATVVVTADRALRARCRSAAPDTVTVGPRWLDALLGAG